MSGIHDAIVDHVQATLINALITVPTALNPNDTSIAGIVFQGPLQGEPQDPDEARISVTIHENDPMATLGEFKWNDEIVEVEIGGSVTTARRFTIMVRALLERSQEDLDAARAILSTVVERIELALLSDIFASVSSGNEYVSRGPMGESLASQIRQGGGPPDAYDMVAHIRFDVLSTRTGIYS